MQMTLSHEIGIFKAEHLIWTKLPELLTTQLGEDCWVEAGGPPHEFQVTIQSERPELSSQVRLTVHEDNIEVVIQPQVDLLRRYEDVIREVVRQVSDPFLHPTPVTAA